MRLTPTQEMHVRNVAAADSAWRSAKVSAYVEAKRIADESVAAHLAKRNALVRIAFEAGVPRQQLGKLGLHTSAPITLTQALERTEGIKVVADAIETDPLAGRYRLDNQNEAPGDGSMLTVALSAEDVRSSTAPAPERFELRMRATDGVFIPFPEAGHETSPVIRWLDAHREELNEWLNK